ncbi:HTH-type transcriptional regulator DmlR [Pandoraea terrae]|uniref:HTH-type transcriptional regulator DmlR n=1 Tax=Pandoraea terrae TaxID=1537710 RepID=A0A5E4TAE5_9BURK|nr:LysR family transcriptional regulator [Pandoraea terrae]VVD85216.1 HTH-type transcriptional regulator DmlR [Pandoraea terrae]
MDRLQSMRVFVKVADNGSFARTAAQMDLSAAVVTRHVAELESHLGVRLLNRTTRSLSLTGAGQAYLERCRLIIDEIDEADALISSASRDPKGTLRVVAPVSFGVRNLAPLIQRYQEQHPKVVVDLTLTDRPVDLVEEGYDCGIQVTRLINSESLISRVLAETRIMLCASPAYIAAHGEPVTPQELAEHGILGLPNELWSDERVFAGPDGEVRVRIHNKLVCNNTALLRQSVLLGQGIAFLPSYLIGGDVRNGDLVAILRNFTQDPVDVSLVYPSRKYLSAKTRGFIDLTVEYFRQNDGISPADRWIPPATSADGGQTPVTL